MRSFAVAPCVRRVFIFAAVCGLLPRGDRSAATETPPAREHSTERQQSLVGGLNPRDDAGPRPVRNDVAQPGEEIVTLRYFRIKKGTFDEFVTVSVEGVWPYFEKLGARVIGMWQVVSPEELGDAAPDLNSDYDEVYLATRYASPAHWKASRNTVKHGGNGPDWDKCRAALATRRGLTQTTHVTFLHGRMAPNGPYFMPGLDERYEPAKPASGTSRDGR